MKRRLRADGISRRTSFGVAMLALAAFARPARAMVGELTVLSVHGMEEAVGEALQAFRRGATLPVVAEAVAARQLRAKLHEGEPPDLVLAEQAAIDDLLRGGARFSERAGLGRVGLGIAVGRDRAMPDVASSDALRHVLLSARSVLQPDPADSAAGVLVTNLLEQLGVAAQVRPKLTLGTGRNPLAAVGFGDAEIGLHTTTEILRAASVKLVAPVPADVQQWTRVDLAMLDDAPNGESARQLMTFLRGPSARAAWEHHGLQAVPG